MTEQTPADPGGPAPSPPPPAPPEPAAPPPAGGAGLSETTQRFAPRQPATPPQTQWSVPAPAAPPPPETTDPSGPSFAISNQGATSPVPGPLATQSFRAGPRPQTPAVGPAAWAVAGADVAATSPAPPGAADPALPAWPGVAAAGAPPAAPAPGAPPFGAPPADVVAYGTATVPDFAPVPTQTAAPAAAPSSGRAGTVRPAGPPKLPAQPGTLKAALGVSILETTLFVIVGVVLLLVANGSDSALQTRLDDYNAKHTAVSADVFQHALDVIGAASIALGIVVLLLALSAAFYGQVSRWLLVAAEALIAGAGGFGITVHVGSVLYVVPAVIVVVLLVAPPTRVAFEDAAAAVEEWRSS